MNCCECQEPVSGRYFEVDGGKSVCQDCYADKYQKECVKCKQKIEGTYYNLGDKFTCASCYKQEHAEKDGKLTCQICKEEVKGKIIRAIGFIFHEECFKCSVCSKDLSGGDTKFTSDEDNVLYCQEDYHEKFSPKCSLCNKPIAPKPGETSAQRLVALDKDWHPQCFKCQDCGLVLDSKAGNSCYPIDKAPYCKACCEKRS